MADTDREKRLERVKAEIARMAARPNTVTFDELERVVEQLGQIGFDVRSKPGRHSHLFRVGDQKVTVCRHNTGRKELKAVYVKEFLKGMTLLGLRDGDES